MEAIDELISAARSFFYDDARANENGRSRSLGHCYHRLSKCADRPSPDYDFFEPAPRFLPGRAGGCIGVRRLLQKDYRCCRPLSRVLKPEYDSLFGVACADLRGLKPEGFGCTRTSSNISIRSAKGRRSSNVLLCRGPHHEESSWERSGACPRPHLGSFRMALQNTK